MVENNSEPYHELHVQQFLSFIVISLTELAELNIYSQLVQ